MYSINRLFFLSLGSVFFLVVPFFWLAMALDFRALENFVIALSDSTFVGYPFPELLGGGKNDTVVQNVFRIELCFTVMVISYSLYFIGLCYLDGTTKRMRLFARGIAIPLFCLTLAFWLKFISEDHIISKIEKTELFQFTIATLVASVLLFAYSLHAKPKGSTRRSKNRDTASVKEKDSVELSSSKDLVQTQPVEGMKVPPSAESIATSQLETESIEPVESTADAAEQAVDPVDEAGPSEESVVESGADSFDLPPLPESDVPVEETESVDEGESLLPPLPESPADAAEQAVDPVDEAGPSEESAVESGADSFDLPPLPESDVPVEETESVDESGDIGPLPPPMTDLLSLQSPSSMESLETLPPLPSDNAGTEPHPDVDFEENEESGTNQS